MGDEGRKVICGARRASERAVSAAMAHGLGLRGGVADGEVAIRAWLVESCSESDSMDTVPELEPEMGAGWAEEPEGSRSAGLLCSDEAECTLAAFPLPTLGPASNAAAAIDLLEGPPRGLR
jgi:hypothetical protein